MKNIMFLVLASLALHTSAALTADSGYGGPQRPDNLQNETTGQVLPEQTQPGPEIAFQEDGAEQQYEQEATRKLVVLVKDAAALVRSKGEAAFAEFRIPGSRWREEETYIFILDPQGNMVVHPDPDLQGKNQLELQDINGKPVIRGLLNAALSNPGKPEGWVHYQWPVPGGLLPRWKSSYVNLAKTPSGKSYVVGCGMYNDRMERGFVVDLVRDAVTQIEMNSDAAFKLFYDPRGSFRVKDAYIFVINEQGVELVNPGFPSLEGRNLMDLKDTHGKLLVREMFETISDSGSGWVDYMWPKPGQSVSTQKSTYVSKAKVGDKWVLVGCGVYLADAPMAEAAVKKMTASELMALVREAAVAFEKSGEAAFPGFRKKGTRWFHDDTYFFVWTLEGVRYFHAANPAGEGTDMSGIKDVLGRAWGKMFLEVAGTGEGEGWVHYMYPEPGDIFPTWKSSYLKRVRFPSGKQYLIGCGIYNMEMDKAFIEDVVNRAAALVGSKGRLAFDELRSKTGPYLFMDTYVFVQSPDGIELVNPAMPTLEGKNLIDMKDLQGKPVIKDQIAAAINNGSAWLTLSWYLPGSNAPALKHTYVKKTGYKGEVFIVGSGFYEDRKP